MSLLSSSVSVPVWLLILLLAAIAPHFVKLFRLIKAYKKGDIVREEHADVVLWKIRADRPSARPKKSTVDVEREKRHQEKSDIRDVLKIMAKEGDRGILIKSLADRMQANISKVQQAIDKLVEKQFVEEVVGMSGTKYYLTQLGRNYCNSKGLQ